MRKIKAALIYIKNNIIHIYDNMYLVIDSLIEVNIITGLNNIPRKVNVKPNGYVAH